MAVKQENVGCHPTKGKGEKGRISFSEITHPWDALLQSQDMKKENVKVLK